MTKSSNPDPERTAHRIPHSGGAKDVKVDVHYLTRVEGHGDITVDVRAGELKECKFKVIESARFFETMLRGRLIYEAQHLTSRICGICACGHSLASIKASEKALGVVPHEDTLLLRKLLLHTEQMDSHLLHAYILVAPDLLGVKSIMPLVKTHRPVIERAFRMKKLSDWAGEILAGRHTHPISFAIGGLTKVPEKAHLQKLREMMVEARSDYAETVELFKKLSLPSFERKGQYVALSSDKEYAFYDGQINVNGEKLVDPQDYLSVIKEEVRDYSSAKFVTVNKAPYMVGALARFNLNGDKLDKKSKEIASYLGLKRPCYNTFMNTVAQVVEWGYCLEDSIDILERLIKNGINEEKVLVTMYPKKDQWPVRTRAGRGVGTVEVPRGILFHDYTVDDHGVVTAANCIIPTNQNINNLEADMKKIVPEIVGTQDEEEMRLTLEMLARAYDPCISCSTHLLDVRFIS
ncbi:MAG: nickel-dependent hydrogenase large subunit [Candidatus Omnitrophota bacterium]|jgi:coenzyme F420-reducing hydrogenase alpha subunit